MDGAQPRARMTFEERQAAIARYTESQRVAAVAPVGAAARPEPEASYLHSTPYLSSSLHQPLAAPPIAQHQRQHQQQEEQQKAPYFTHECFLCSAPLPAAVKLKDHLPSCPRNTESCPHCRRGFQARLLAAHVAECRQHGRSCFVCDRAVPARTYLTHVNGCQGRGDTNVSSQGAAPVAAGSEGAGGGGRLPVRMYHGTTHEVAALVLASRLLHPSDKGLLGEGVYVTADINKALRYGPAVIECAVYPGRTLTVARRFHPQQKNWRAHGYDSAWIPPNAFISTSRRAEEAVDNNGAATDAAAAALLSEAEQHARLVGTRNATGGDLEENCVADPRRVVPLRVVRGAGLTSGDAPVAATSR